MYNSNKGKKNMVLIEHPLIKGFYQNQFRENLYISIDGLVFNEDTKSFISKVALYGGYKCINVNRKTIGLHRLLAETFIQKPIDIPENKLVVNHKNGIKTDNELSNIEWTSYKGNLLHAYKNGLRPEIKAILVKDLRNNQLTRFYCLQDCARHFKVNGSRIFNQLKTDVRVKPFLKYYSIIREGEEWPVMISINDPIMNLGYSKDVFVIDKQENKSYIFSGFEEVSKLIGIKGNTLRKRIMTALSKGIFWVEDDNYKYALLSNVLREVDESKAIKVQPKKQEAKHLKIYIQPKEVSVTDIKTGITKIYSNIIEVAKILGVTRDALQKRLWRYNGVWNNKYQIDYINSKRSYSSVMR